MSYSLGVFNFINMTPAPPRTLQRWGAEMRPGVDGVLLWDTGRRGAPFVCQTVVNAATLPAAQQVYAYYQESSIAGPLPIVWNGVLIADTLYKVLDVRLVELRAVAGIGGVVNGPSYGLLRAEWELYPIAVL